MPYIPTECKFGFLTDTHFSVVRNNFRTDSFFDSVISKFSQCYDHFNASGCEFIVHGGDMFDKYRSYSHPMILKIREVIVNSKIPTYFIWGQHDLLGYNRDSSRNSNLEFLKEICDGKLKELNDHVDAGSLHLYASHVDQDPAEVFQKINRKRSFKPSVVVAHALLYNTHSNFGTIDIYKFDNIKPTLVLSGDLHSGFEATQIGNTTFYNPGSLARTEKTDRKPKCVVITLKPFLTEWTVNIEEFFPECEDYPFPEETMELKVSDQQDSDEYIEAFEKFKSESKDIIEHLEKVGTHHKIDREVLEYIKSKRNMK